MRKRKNEPLHLKDSFLHLKIVIRLKFALDKSKSAFSHIRRRTRKTPFSTFDFGFAAMRQLRRFFPAPKAPEAHC